MFARVFSIRSLAAMALLAQSTCARAEAPSCDQSVKTASERLVFTAKDGKKYFLGTEVRGAAAADPAKLCEKSKNAPLGKKLCERTFTDLNKNAKAYLSELGRICREISKTPACERADHACARRTTEQGRMGQEKMLKLLNTFNPSDLEKSISVNWDAYKKAIAGLFRAFQEANDAKKLAELKARTSIPLAPPARGTLEAGSLGVSNMEQAWAVLTGTPLPGRSSTISSPNGPLLKELQNVKAVAEHLRKGFIDLETADRKKTTTELASLGNRNATRDGRQPTITGNSNQDAQGRRAGQGAPSGAGTDDLFKLAQQGLGTAASAMQGQKSGAGAAQAPTPQGGTQAAPQAPAPPASQAIREPTQSGSTVYRDVNVLSSTGGGSLIAGVTGSQRTGGTGAIRRYPGSEELALAEGSRSGARANPSGREGSERENSLSAAVKDAITASQAVAGTESSGGSAAPAGAAAPAKSGESLADLFARFDNVAGRVKESLDKDPLGAIASIFSGGASGPAESSGSSGSIASAPTPPSVKSIDAAPAPKLARASGPKRSPASEPIGDYFSETVPEEPMHEEFSAGITIEEETLFRRVHLKLQEKAGQIPVSQL